MICHNTKSTTRQEFVKLCQSKYQSAHIVSRAPVCIVWGRLFLNLLDFRRCWMKSLCINHVPKECDAVRSKHAFLYVEA